jgi:hypothetical protein
VRVRRAALAAAAAGVAICASPALGDPTAPTHTITDELHGAWTDLPPDGTAPTPGVVYTQITVDHSDWWENQPVHDRFEFSHSSSDVIIVTHTTYAADGSVAAYDYVDGIDDLGFTTKLTFAPDLSWVRISGTLHIYSYDGTSSTDHGAQPIDVTLTATSHQQNLVPSATTNSVDADLGSGTATGSLTASLGTLWSGTVPTARFDRTDHLVESTS